MTGRILRQEGHRCVQLILDKSDRERIGRLGREAEAIFVSQDQHHWARASNPDFLPRLVGGAIVLQRLGCETKNAIVLEDDGAHLAFITCCAMALILDRLDPDLRRALKETIKLLALCCPIEVTVVSLPPFESLPASYKRTPSIIQVYRDFPRDNGNRDVTLFEALTLLRIFQRAGRPEDCGILAELLEVTEGLITALARLREADKK